LHHYVHKMRKAPKMGPTYSSKWIKYLKNLSSPSLPFLIQNHNNHVSSDRWFGYRLGNKPRHIRGFSLNNPTNTQHFTPLLIFLLSLTFMFSFSTFAIRWSLRFFFTDHVKVTVTSSESSFVYAFFFSELFFEINL
jgi:hypothetical protein